jgi:hypothetical protein
MSFASVVFLLQGVTLVGVGNSSIWEIDTATGAVSQVLNLGDIGGASDSSEPHQVYVRTAVLDLLLLVDLTSGTFQALGPTNPGVLEVAFDEARAELWGVEMAHLGSKLYQLNPYSGVATDVAGLFSTHPTVPVGNIVGLDYDVVRDRLVGTDQINVWEIGKRSGACTWIGAHNAPGLVDIYCDPVTGDYWGVSGPVSELLEINPDTGLASHKWWLLAGPFRGLAAHEPRDTGIPFCTATTNSTGFAAKTMAYGMGSVVTGGLLLATEDLPAGRPVLLIASLAWSFIPPSGNTVGYQCVIGSLAVFREDLTFAGPGGRVVHEVDLALMPTRPLTTAVMPGDTWYFQTWYRDSLVTGPTTNYSLPTEVSF